MGSYNNAAYYCRNMLGYRSSRFNFFIMSLIYCTCCTTKHTHTHTPMSDPKAPEPKTEPKHKQPAKPMRPI